MQMATRSGLKEEVEDRLGELDRSAANQRIPTYFLQMARISALHVM
jgi:hypothetical protein